MRTDENKNPETNEEQLTIAESYDEKQTVKEATAAGTLEKETVQEATATGTSEKEITKEAAFNSEEPRAAMILQNQENKQEIPDSVSNSQQSNNQQQTAETVERTDKNETIENQADKIEMDQTLNNSQAFQKTENVQSVGADVHKEEKQPAVSEFHHQVLKSFHKEYTDEQIKKKQQQWQKYEEQEEPVNDFPQYFFAGFWIRLFAFIIDVLCIQAIVACSVGLIYGLANIAPVAQGLSLYHFLSLVIYLGYFTLLTKLNNGQTIGKIIFGIRVVSLTEPELTWKTVLIREVCGRYILQFSWLFYFGYLPAAFSQKKQQLADYFADTSVVTVNLIHAFNKKATV